MLPLRKQQEQCEIRNTVKLGSRITTGVNQTLLRDLFYRCQFHSLVNTLEGIDFRLLGPSDYFELGILRVNTMFELNQAENAALLLQELADQGQGHRDSPAYTYALARLCYYQSEHEQAKKLFLKLYQDKECTKFRVRGLLGMANTSYSQQRYHEVPGVMDRIRSHLSESREDEQISVEVFSGHFYRATEEYTKAKDHYYNAMKMSSRSGWSYFSHWSMYGLAAIARTQQAYSEVDIYQRMLNATVDPEECIHFNELIQRQFSQSHSDHRVIVEVDTTRQRIKIGDHWLCLSESPLVLRFMALLGAEAGIVEKCDVAEHLWPEETYLPRTHNPRICNLARRIKDVLIRVPEQPIELQSSKIGYKLAYRSIEERSND